MHTNLLGVIQRPSRFPTRRMLLLLAAGLASAGPAQGSITPETSMAAEVMRYVEDSPEYLDLHSLYERRRRTEGDAWIHSARGQRARTALDRLRYEAATATTLDPTDPAGRHIVNFTSPEGRVTRLTSIVPRRVEEEADYRRDIVAVLCRFILSEAYWDGVLLLPALPAAARAELGKGIEAARKPDFRSAIQHFEAARKTPYFSDYSPWGRKAPEIYFNLALAESRLPGRELRAIAWFGAYLAADPYTAAPNEADIRAEIQRLWQKNQANLANMIRTLEAAATTIFEGLGRNQGEELASGDDIRIRDRKGRNLCAVTRLWAEAGDLAAATRTVGTLHREEYHRYGVSDIAEAQAGFDDIAGALKTAAIIPEPKFLNSILHAVVCAQVRNGDLVAARQTLGLMPAGVSREWAEYAIQTGHPIVPGRYDLHLPFDRALLNRMPAERTWVTLLEDTEANHDCPLHTTPFLELSGTLSGYPASNDPQVVFDALLDTVNRVALARHIVDRLLRVPPEETPRAGPETTLDTARAARIAEAMAGAEAIRQSLRPWADRVSIALPAATAFVRTLAGKGFPFMPIPAGRFVPGGVDDKGHAPGGDDPGPPVVLTQPFFLAATELTQAQWTGVMGGNPSDPVDDLLPVTAVSWDEAMTFCQKLTERERAAGRLPVGWKFTLPTEAQWEFACRAGTSGPNVPGLDATAWSEANREGRENPRPVATKQANAWGLYDMLGNVWEMCLDWEGAETPATSVTDPTGPDTGSMRVLCGGSIFDAAEDCDASARASAAPGDQGNWGFRVALVPVR